MEITADKTYVNLIDDGDYPVNVYFYDEALDYCFSLCRHNYPDVDNGEINIMLLDQIHTDTKNLTVNLDHTKLVAEWPAEIAAQLLNVDRMIVNFSGGLKEIEDVRKALADMFRDLPGLSDKCSDAE